MVTSKTEMIALQCVWKTEFSAIKFLPCDDHMIIQILFETLFHSIVLLSLNIYSYF